MIKKLLQSLLLILSVCSPAELLGQTAMKEAPDCLRSFAFSVAANGTSLANYGTGSPDGANVCVTWTFAYAVATTGTVTSLSIRVESALAGTTQNTPGSWGAYAGSAQSGSITNTSTTGAQATLANGTVPIPWVRVALTALSATGTTVVFGQLQGWTSGHQGSGGGGGGTCATLGGDVIGNCAANTVFSLSALSAHQVPVSEGSSAMAGAGPGATSTCLMGGGASADPSFTTCTSYAIRVTVFASLAAPADSSVAYCSDCTIVSSINNTCAGSGTGAMADRINGAWKCYQ